MKLNLNENDIYVLAVSTGVDSMVLLDLAKQNNLNIIVAHVNHNKRDSSIDEQNFITEYCKNNNIKLEILQYKYIDKNFQNEARIARYNFFYDVAIKHKANTILTAHHSYDNVETVLINILRGGNLLSYSGIKESNINEITIKRPLLNYSKNEIYNYANNNNVTYFEDDSNKEDIYLRNNIRNNILNNLENINKDFDKKFLQYSNLLNETYDFIRSTSLSYFKDDKIQLDQYLSLHITIQKDILNCFFEKYNITSSTSKLNDCIEVLKNTKPNLTYNLQDNYRLIKEYNYFYITDKLTKEICITMGEFDKCEIPVYGRFYFTNILPKTYTSYVKMCYNKLDFPVKIRTRVNGDKVKIKNGHKKISDLFIDLKIPKEKRDEILLVETNNNEIIWVIDYYKKKVDENFIYLVNEGE